MRIFSQSQNQQNKDSEIRSSIKTRPTPNHPSLSQFQPAHNTESRFAHDFSRVPARTPDRQIVQDKNVIDNGAAIFSGGEPHIFMAGKSAVKTKPTDTEESTAVESLEQASATAPKLEMTTISGPIDGKCGRFKWVIQWMLDKLTTKGGLVVQKIDSKSDVKDCGGNSFIPAIEVFDPGWYPFWEAWEISPGQKITKDAELGSPSDDTFFRGSKKMDTKGEFSYTGSAQFYEGAQLSKTNLKAMHNPPAGDLPMSKSKPNLPPGSGEISHNLKATWDCCSKDKNASKDTFLDTK